MISTNQIISQLSFLEKDAIKQDERIAIQSFLEGQRSGLIEDQNNLQNDLDNLSVAMDKYASETLVSDLAASIDGKTKKSAQEYLINGIKNPDFKTTIDIS